MPEIIFYFTCCKCKKAKTSKEFPPNKQKLNGLGSHCRKCVGEYRSSEKGKFVTAKYRERNRIRIRQYQSNYLKTNKGKVNRKEIYRRSIAKYKARAALNHALERSEIIKPNKCSICNSDYRIQAHHHLGYSQEHWFDVVWVCYYCHRELDEIFVHRSRT